MSSGHADSAIADDADGRWLSLAELAALRGISKASAARLVRRHKWRRQPDNQGRVRVLVPPSAAEAGPDSPADSPRDSPADISRLISTFEAATTVLRERAEAAERRADAAERRADAAETGRDADRARADGQRDRLDVLQILLADAEKAAERARAQAREAQDGAEGLWQADAERRQAGLLARLMAAWRGE